LNKRSDVGSERRSDVALSAISSKSGLWRSRFPFPHRFQSHKTDADGHQLEC
jgi:hypothetical protein